MRETCYINHFMISEIIIGKNIYCEMGFCQRKLKEIDKLGFFFWLSSLLIFLGGFFLHLNESF